MEQPARKHFIVYGKGLSTDLVDKIAASTNAIQIPTSQGTYIGQGMPFVEFWPRVAGFNEDQIRDEKKKLDGSVVTIVQSVGRPYSENFAYAKLAANNAKRFGAKVVNVVFPFYDLREDKDYPNRGTSFANPMFAEELAAAGVDHVTFMAPHSKAGVEQFRKVFGKNVSVVEMPEIMVPLLKERFGDDVDNVVNAAPDGWNKPTDQAFSCAVDIAKSMHGEERYEGHLFGIEKERKAAGESQILSFHGNVDGKTAVLADDMIDGGGTMVHAAEQANAHGAKKIYTAAPHGIFSKTLSPLLAAHSKDGNLLIEQVITTNTLPVEDAIGEVRSQFPSIRDRVVVADVSPFVVREMEKVAGMADQVARESQANRRTAISK